jgi:Na+/phosphate symporter
MQENPFKKNVFSQGQTLFTQQEFNEALEDVKKEIMAYAMQATMMAIMLEREACAKMADECVNIEELGDAIRNRIPEQRQ